MPGTNTNFTAPALATKNKFYNLKQGQQSDKDNESPRADENEGGDAGHGEGHHHRRGREEVQNDLKNKFKSNGQVGRHVDHSTFKA